MITFEELAQRFPIRNVAPYGACVVVPGVEFDPDWEVYLGDQGCRCIMTDLDGAPVTLVQRKNVTGQGMRDVYVPSQAKEAFPNCAFCGSSNVKKYGIRHNRAGDVQRFFCNDCGKKFSYREDFGFKMKHSNKIIQFAQQLASQTDPAYSLRDIAAEIKKRFGVKVSHNAIQRWLEPEKKESGGGMESMENKESTKSTKSKKGGFKGNPEHLWKPEENELLIALWNRKPKLTKAKIIKEFRIKFPNRSPGSFSNHLWVLQQAGKIERRFSMKRKGSKAPKEEKVTEDTKSLQSNDKVDEKSTATIHKDPEPVSATATESTTSTTLPTPVEDPVISLLKEIRDLLKPETFDFEYHCPKCNEHGSVCSSETVWQRCPVCGAPLIVWNVEA